MVYPSDTPVVATVVFTGATSPCTSTTSWADDGFNVAVIRVVSVIRTTIPGNFVFANPGELTSTEYAPTGKKGTVNTLTVDGKSCKGTNNKRMVSRTIHDILRL